MDQEGQDPIHAAIWDQFKVDGLIEDVLTDQDVVPGLIALQVTRTDSVDLMDLVRVLGAGSRVVTPGQGLGNPQGRIRQAGLL
jgi:hypothetical protein